MHRIRDTLILTHQATERPAPAMGKDINVAIEKSFE
jgi:hypothetical protein